MMQRLVLAVLGLLVGCRRAEKQPVARQERACFPASSWRAVQGAPPADLSLGMVQHPLSSPALHDYQFEVRWSAGAVSQVTAAELLASPEGALVPILHPLTMPAVFEVDAKQALVWGARGWGCVDRHSNGKDCYQSHDDALARAVATIEAFRKVNTDASGYTFHEALMVTLSGPLHVEASDAAATATPARIERSECRVVLDSSQLQARPELPSIQHLGASKSTVQMCATPVRIVRQTDDWAEVVLPREGSPLYRTDRFLVVRWSDRPAGWARLWAPGSVPGSKQLRWHIQRWHMGP